MQKCKRLTLDEVIKFTSYKIHLIRTQSKQRPKIFTPSDSVVDLILKAANMTYENL